MWRSVELREIRVFLTLAEELHFGRTAERLGLTQSRVSQTVRALEASLGERLLDRTSRRVTLTRAGERLRTDLEPAYQHLIGVLRAFSESNESMTGMVRLGVTAAGALSPGLLRVIEVFEALHVECKVQVVELPFLDRHGPLRRGDVDVMVTRLPLDQRDIVVGPVVSRDQRVLAVARDHPLAKRSSVTFAEIADYQVADVSGLGPKEIGGAFVPEKTPAGRPLKRSRATVHDFTDLVVLIARGRIVHPTVASAIPRFGHPNIVCMPIVDMPPSSTALAWRRGSSDPRLRALIGIARDVLRASSRPANQPKRRAPAC